MKRYSVEERERLVEEWRQSGKSKWAFAKELGLSAQTLNNWTKKAEKEGKVQFVEVSAQLEREADQGRTGLLGARTFCAREVVVEQEDARVRLPQGATREDLALALEALRRSHDR